MIKYWFIGMVLGLFLGAFVLMGCEVDHNVSITLGVDHCLTHYPECGDFGYACVNVDGEVASECIVGCLASVTLMCEEDGPHCYNEAAGTPIELPVICVPTHNPNIGDQIVDQL